MQHIISKSCSRSFAHAFGSGGSLAIIELQGAMEGSRLAIFLQSDRSSVSGGSQDGAQKESEGRGNELHD
jgi:hypothetical protein